MHVLLQEKSSYGSGLRTVVLVPTKELCELVKREQLELLRFLGGAISGTAISTSTTKEAAQTTLAALPSVLVATPGRLAKYVTWMPAIS